jgi:uncharacterized membrane protein YsdA (DUF1294 family)
LDVLGAEGFKWRTPTKRLAVIAALTNGATGIWFAVFQVQGWTMPDALAIALLIPVGITIVGSLAVAVVEVVRNVHAFIEHRATNALFVLETPPGFLDYLPDGLTASERFSNELLLLGEDTEELGEKIEKHTARLTALVGLDDAYAPQREANRSAKSIARSAAYIEKRLELLEACVTEIDRNFRPWVATQTITSDEDFEIATVARNSIESGRVATLESLTSTSEYRDTYKQMAEMNAARTVRIAASRLADALSGIVRVLKRYEKSAGNLVGEFDKRVEEWSRQQGKSV